MPERNWPVNITEEDEVLFKNNKYYENRHPKLERKFNVIIDPFRLLAYPERNKWQQLSFIFGNLALRDLVKHKTYFFRTYGLVLDHWSSNYFHWFTEVIPKIIWLKKEQQLKYIDVPAWLLKISFVSKSLKFIPDCEVRVINRAQNNVIHKAYWCSLQMVTGNYNPAIVHSVREVFCSGDITNKKPGRRFFIYRDAKKGRGIVNFEEIKPVLNFFSIEIIDFELIDWENQLAMFQEAELLIGVHGAGLTNMLFMPRINSNILELRRSDDSHNNCYYSLADALAIPYYYLKCEVDSKLKATQQNNFIVDGNKLNQILNKIINDKDV